MQRWWDSRHAEQERAKAKWQDEERMLALLLRLGVARFCCCLKCYLHQTQYSARRATRTCTSDAFFHPPSPATTTCCRCPPAHKLVQDTGLKPERNKMNVITPSRQQLRLITFFKLPTAILHTKVSCPDRLGRDLIITLVPSACFETWLWKAAT